MRPFDIPIMIVLLAGFAYYVYRHITHGMNKEGQQAQVETAEVE